jgi:hypothetical protein
MLSAMKTRWGVKANNLSKCSQSRKQVLRFSALSESMRAHDSNGEQMPEYGSLMTEDIKGLVAYIRTLKK